MEGKHTNVREGASYLEPLIRHPLVVVFHNAAHILAAIFFNNMHYA
jgi:hypothetical protein